MRGEHRTCKPLESQVPGSSPHARGTLPAHGFGAGNAGIIPACAGNTDTPKAGHAESGDHPRMRGEHWRDILRTRAVQGSSPHARGTHNGLKLCEFVRGIIPACAGNTSRGMSAEDVRRDHPRMRGEHRCEWCGKDRRQGSSPHARGTLSDIMDAFRQRGIIPACAGNTSAPSAWPDTATDHPRMRGEHRSGIRPDDGAPGSSPHARGTPDGPSLRALGRGIIPACAGNTLGRSAWCGP